MKRLSAEEQTATPFWRSKSLEDMSKAEWESLCDGCGRCCMLKLEDEDTGVVHMTRVSCRLLDIGQCRCTQYSDRQEIVSDCLSLTPIMARTLEWLPETCAYRVVGEGRELAWWHPLISGSTETVHEAGISVRYWAIPETPTRSDALYRYLIIED
ncbi:MAG: YcgN family cysteine cluster protein [Hyphomicrobiaceae bacterium]